MGHQTSKQKNKNEKSWHMGRMVMGNSALISQPKYMTLNLETACCITLFGDPSKIIGTQTKKLIQTDRVDVFLYIKGHHRGEMKLKCDNECNGRDVLLTLSCDDDLSSSSISEFIIPSRSTMIIACKRVLNSNSFSIRLRYTKLLSICYKVYVKYISS